MVGTVIWGTLAGASAATLAAGRPWTELLARRRWPAEVRALPLFHESNLVLTAGWTLLFSLAAAISAVSPSWVSPILAAPTPLLGRLSYRLGPKYVEWRVSRGASA
jgi:hypothetical protein